MRMVQAEIPESGASQDDVNRASASRFVPHSHSTSPVTNLGTDLKG